MSFSIGARVGAYIILERLGRGGMATVYRAHHQALDRDVAIKMMHPAFTAEPTFLRRFTREARVVAQLEHPAIVPVYDFAEHEGHPYLVMRLIEGETLKERLKQGRLSRVEIERIVSRVAEGLEYAHGRGVLHRDVKPSNIMLSAGGGVYLTDFGLARLAEAGESTLSQDLMLGTPQYISPEQARGDRAIDKRTDIYSLGAVLFELVCGRVPFTADTLYTLIHDQIFSQVPDPSQINPNVPASVSRVLQRALAKEPAERFASAGELAAAFRQAVAGMAAEFAPADQTLLPDYTPLSATQLSQTPPPALPAEPALSGEPPPLPDVITASEEETALPLAPAAAQATGRREVAGTPSSPAGTADVARVARHKEAAAAQAARPKRRRGVFQLVAGMALGMFLCFLLILVVNGIQQRQAAAGSDQASPEAGAAATAISPTATATPAAVVDQPATGQPTPTLARPLTTLRPFLVPAVARVRPSSIVAAELSRSPGNVQLQAELALAYSLEGKSEDARLAIDLLFSRAESPIFYVVAAQSLMAVSAYYPAARMALEHGLARFPQNPDMQHLLVMNLILSDSDSAELSALLATMEPDGHNRATILMAEAYIQFSQGHPEEALRVLEEAEQLDSPVHLAEVLVFRALILEQSGETALAEEAMRQALAHDPPLWLAAYVK